MAAMQGAFPKIPLTPYMKESGEFIGFWRVAARASRQCDFFALGQVLELALAGAAIVFVENHFMDDSVAQTDRADAF